MTLMKPMTVAEAWRVVNAVADVLERKKGDRRAAADLRDAVRLLSSRSSMRVHLEAEIKDMAQCNVRITTTRGAFITTNPESVTCAACRKWVARLSSGVRA